MNDSGGNPAKRKKIVLCSAVAGAVLVILLTVIGIFCLTGGQENDGYYVEYNGTRYTPGETGAAMSLTSGETYEFSVLSDTGAKAEYSVKITSNPEKNFSFQVGNEQCWFYDENETRNDYSQTFSLTQEEEKNQHEQQKLLQAGMTGVQTDIVQRYGSAIKGHAVA